MKTLLLSSTATALLALAPAAAQDTQERTETEQQQQNQTVGEEAEELAQEAEREAEEAAQDVERAAEEAERTAEQAGQEAETEAEQFFGADSEAQDDDYRADRDAGEAGAAAPSMAAGSQTQGMTGQTGEQTMGDEPMTGTQDTMADRLAQEEEADVTEEMQTAEDAETLNRMEREKLAEEDQMRQRRERQAGMEESEPGQRMMQGEERMRTAEPGMQERDRRDQQRTAQAGQQPDLESAALIYRSTAALAPTALTAQELLGADLVDESGKKLARVEDVIVNQQGMAEGVILAAGGVFGLGADNYAIDFNRIEGIRTGDEIRIVSQLTERDIERLREFDLDEFEENMGPLMLASELRGMDLPIGEAGNETARVEDVVMSRTGQVEAFVVSYDDDRYVAPFSEIGVAEGDGGLYIDTEPALVGALAVYEGLTGTTGAMKAGDKMKNKDTMRRRMDQRMQERSNRDGMMQDGERRMNRGDMTEQGMETDDSMGMGEELGTEEDDKGGGEY